MSSAISTRVIRAAARQLGRLAHLYQCAKCGGWTEYPTCPVCPPQ